MRYDASKVTDLASNIAEQRRLAHWLAETSGTSVLIDMYRARPVTTEGGQTRLLGRRGPTGRIVAGGDKFVTARFPRARLQRWARAWFAAHGAVDAEPAPRDAEFVEEYLLKHGLPVTYHTLIDEDI